LHDPGISASAGSVGHAVSGYERVRIELNGGSVPQRIRPGRSRHDAPPVGWFDPPVIGHAEQPCCSWTYSSEQQRFPCGNPAVANLRSPDHSLGSVHEYIVTTANGSGDRTLHTDVSTVRKSGSG